jgi:3-dehydro-L-gulonate 2-dehydrogenase
MRLSFDEVRRTLAAILLEHGLTGPRAEECARLFAETTRDGVYTHGVARFPRLIQMIRLGVVDPAAEPERVSGFGALERWNGRRGVGNLNAARAMGRAIELGRAHGIGCVALGNTNHWMRGGSYGWQAAEAGLIGLCWTNTMPNLPPWGSAEAVIGNNPMVLAVPRAAGPVVLDMAMSQFSYGALEASRKRGELLSVDGGFDENGTLTRDPAAIERSRRPLPIGYWKGSGLSALLDMTAAMLALGRATHELAPDSLQETGISQLFIAIAPAALGDAAQSEKIVDGIIASLHAARPEKADRPVRYPGEQTLKLREENTRRGLPVDETLWAQIVKGSF